MLADALALWRGPAYADFADEPFARAEIARLEELRLTALEDHAEHRLALGDHAALAGELADLLTVHPLRERLRAAHLLALYRTGRQSEALDAYEAHRARLADELGLDPGTELTALHQAILRQDPSLNAPPRRAEAVTRPGTRAARAAVRGNLREPASGLIGRDEAVAEIGDRLAEERLVTLTGPGGVGKTRLALATAAGLAGDAFPDGVWLVELAAFERSATAVPEAVAHVLDLRDDPGDDGSGGPSGPAGRLADALAGRRLLLVLDNCEHLIDEAADLAGRLLGAAPGLRILATSREPLALPGEVVWSVPPLDVPAPGAADPGVLERSSAVRLFVARASAAARDFRLDAGTAEAVAVLCRRLDGIPLALELAATRVRALGAHGLVDRLDDRFRLLATGHRGAPPRQRTLTAMIDWSWELLSDPERAVLRRLSVHADGCTLDAAEAVCADPDGGDGALDVLDLLVRLVDRSLVVMEDRGGDGPRYRLLESVAAYCADRLDEAGERARVRARHRDYYTGLAERAEPYLYGPGQARRLRLLDGEAANLRAALDGAVADGDRDGALRLANALTWYWYLRGRLAEADRSLRAALALPAGPEPAPAARVARAKAAAWLAAIGVLRGDEAGWPAARDEALRLFAGEDEGERARAQWLLAWAGSENDHVADGGARVAEAFATFERLGDRWGMAAAHVLMAKLAHARGETDALEREGRRAARLFGRSATGGGSSRPPNGSARTPS
ncbi:BTAD domain-containing putative transcriptional regulator [Actinomadura sp. J1-007]|uniref:ATP-binding protein n=1 Tax=Actinomadura sp. J1-007 TaxID=2661913 RepID=UPI001F4F3E1B|nr:BTAD domain-containing putative transcriptional regulator [Actinomadura sp. J1-007]